VYGHLEMKSGHRFDSLGIRAQVAPVGVAGSSQTEIFGQAHATRVCTDKTPCVVSGLILPVDPWRDLDSK
jgi:hypothetical protein